LGKTYLLRKTDNNINQGEKLILKENRPKIFLLSGFILEVKSSKIKLGNKKHTVNIPQPRLSKNNDL